MKIHHIRNATTLLEIGEHRLLIDPMLSDVGTLPGFKVFGGGKQRNPLVPLPPETEELLESATAVVITHEHPDHFDKAGLAWVRERKLPVWANARDIRNLRSKGLSVQLLEDGALGMAVEVIPSKHGRGWFSWFMGPVAGYYLSHQGEPSIYITGDTVLTDAVLEAVDRLQPDIILAPAGTANMGIGGNILFSVDELITLIKRAPGQVVLNHLEALDHCATTREGLGERIRSEGLTAHIPHDGEAMEFEVNENPGAITLHHPMLKPGFQKWLTKWFSGT